MSFGNGECDRSSYCTLKHAHAGDCYADSPVVHPKHYNSHPSGIECIQVVQWMGFNIGNAIKYLWRADLKGNAIEDLQKAREYIDFELAKRKVSK